MGRSKFYTTCAAPMLLIGYDDLGVGAGKSIRQHLADLGFISLV